MEKEKIIAKRGKKNRKKIKEKIKERKTNKNN